MLHAPAHLFPHSRIFVPMTIERLYEIYLRHPSIRTDTRQLQKGDLFFALKGPNFNGNSFAARALELGAAYAVIDEAPGQLMTSTPSPASPLSPGPADILPPYISDRLIIVPDTLQTLQGLALHHRRQFSIPFIAITGSNGKTTTKELIHAVLSSTYTTYTTQGNLNNHIGIPLTILSVRSDAQLAVIEMGANHQKEIEGYCRYTLPTHGIITNVGKAHLEGFGGPEGVKKGKGELYDFLRSKDVPAIGTNPSPATAFVLHDSADLRYMSRGIPHIITYGTHDADITGISLSPGGWYAIPPIEKGQPIPPPPAGWLENMPAPHPDAFLAVKITHGASINIIGTQLVGDYNLPNVLAAVAVGKHFGIPDSSIRQAIELYNPSNSRSQMIERDGNHIILDAYNANPSSMLSAIENFARMPNPGFDRKVLILGAMAELGPESLNEHRAIVNLIAQYPWHQVVLVGGDFEKTDHPYLSFPDSRAAAAWLRNAGLKDVYLLIKGSRSMKMEEVLK